MKWVALVVVASTALATVLSVRACTEINKEIDRCDDQTSGAYIRDDAVRRSECGR
jgi:outer membrane protein assembly factor BamE (lipoprotein component of BamABCDE complex)